MKLLGFFLMAAALAGCASGPLSSKRDLESSGKQEGTVITCSGGYKTWLDCDRQAAQTCPKGYEVLSKEELVVMQARTLRINCK
jgi:hypothetical protein